MNRVAERYVTTNNRLLLFAESRLDRGASVYDRDHASIKFVRDESGKSSGAQLLARGAAQLHDGRPYGRFCVQNSTEGTLEKQSRRHNRNKLNQAGNPVQLCSVRAACARGLMMGSNQADG